MCAANILTKYPAADRNKGPILAILEKIFQTQLAHKKELNVLEIGSATGQHIAHFASAFPRLQFQPSDVDNKLFENIVQFRSELNLKNLLDPVVLDLTWPVARWPTKKYDVLYCSNVLHISPWCCSVGLFEGANHVLHPTDGLLIVYGPFAVDGLITPQSNIDFDESLKQRNSAWGIRDTRALKNLAYNNRLQLAQIFDMPANNKILLFKRIQSE